MARTERLKFRKKSKTKKLKPKPKLVYFGTLTAIDLDLQLMSALDQLPLNSDGDYFLT